MKSPLPPNPPGTTIMTMPRFLLRSAVHARQTINGYGLALRWTCVLVVCGALAWMEGSTLRLVGSVAPVALGVTLASLEWLEKPADHLLGGSSRTGRRIAMWVVASRESAAASVSGVLEVLVGPLVAASLFMGPWPVEGSPEARVAAVLAIVVFEIVATIQTMTDAGYYNFVGSPPDTLYVLFRSVLPLLVGAALAGLYLWTPDGLLPSWVGGAAFGLLVVTYVAKALTDAVQGAALRAHASSVEEALIQARERSTSDFHQVKSTIRAQQLIAETRIRRLVEARKMDPDDEIVALVTKHYRESLDELWLQTEGLRLQAREPISTPTLQSCLEAYRLALRHRGQAGVTSCDADESYLNVLLDPIAADVIRHLVLDLVDNAFKSQVDPPRIMVTIATEVSSSERRKWLVTVTDDGPGFDVPDRFPRRSSTHYLLMQCQASDGGLQINSGPGGTVAEGWIHTRDLGGAGWGPETPATG